MNVTQPQVVIIGAGVGGLTTAALLARAGISVTVLEAHLYAGGCAGTFFHQGYRFDAGATLAGGFYNGGPMDTVAKAVGITDWSAHATDHALTAHLSDGTVINRVGGEERWQERRRAFGNAGISFFQWQEQTADLLWNFAERNPAFPPQTASDIGDLLAKSSHWLASNLSSFRPTLPLDAFRSVASHLKNAPANLRQFIDAQLLIAAQATSDQTNALYGASALDLPRRGIVHLQGGIGTIADKLVQAVRNNGGQVLFRHEATRIVIEKGRPIAVEFKKGKRGSPDTIPADVVVANLPVWNIAKLLGDVDELPRRLRNLPPKPRTGWGAAMAYIGVDHSAIPQDFPLHHQIVAREPLADGNTVFLSFSPAWDNSRAPAGQRALTISTHTDLGQWWQLFHENRPAYEAKKQAYAERLVAVAEKAVPNLRQAASLILPGTPVTFQRYTKRHLGWVGGYPQTNLLRVWGPRLTPDLWMVGDSIFPGQSTAAVALGGLRTAKAIMERLGIRDWRSQETFIQSPIPNL